MAAEPAKLMWRKSRASADQDTCVEVAFRDSAVLVRDSRGNAGVILEVPSGSWREFISRIRAGRSAVIP